MKKKYIVDLTDSEVANLESIICKGKSSAREIRRAHILLLAHEGKKDSEIAAIAKCSATTVQLIRHRFSEKRMEALKEKSRCGRPEKLLGKAKAHLIALACSNPPEGKAMWTLRLLADRCVSLDLVDDLSHETVRKILKKMK